MDKDDATAARDVRRAGRRAIDPVVSSAGGQVSPGSNLPALVAPARDASPLQSAGPVEAQILGQEGQKRGLRGGKPVLDHARSAYLGAEWSGSADRRPKRGLIAKTEI